MGMQRDSYRQRLIDWKDTNMIKVITGIGRGRSK